jgi:hypothetical protein
LIPRFLTVRIWGIGEEGVSDAAESKREDGIGTTKVEGGLPATEGGVAGGGSRR